MHITTISFEYTDPAKAFTAIAHLPYSLLLDSADQTHPDARYSYILSNPLEIIESKNGDITITSREKLTNLSGKDPFNILQDRLNTHGFSNETIPDLPPFQGGLAGLFGYDLGRNIEKIPNTAIDNPDMPDLAVGLYDQVIAFDHAQQKAWIITHANNEFETEMKQAVLLHNIAAARRGTSPIVENASWQAEFKPTAFKQRIEKVRDYILNGDIFQANLAQQFTASLPAHFDPYAHYCDMRTLNPAPFASYMNIGNIKIASCSPERFLNVDTHGKVETKPIKGTRARMQDPQKDATAILALRSDEKERAENIMITDLLRNDLSKCCEENSITVPKLCEIESFAGLHHLVSTVQGQLRADQSAIDLLRACFPGGSITGAPKIRAMEIIEELEPTRRGPYCGSIAAIGFNGTLASNILIRTLVYDDNQVSFKVGSGITASSDPDAEYEETLTKARKLFESFESNANHYKLAG